MKKTLVYATAVFGIFMVIAVWIGGKKFVEARSGVKTVSVVGMAERDFDSDLIVWSLSFNVLNDDMKGGYTEIKRVNQIVREYLTQKGVKSEDVDFRSLNCNKETEYHYNNGNSYYTFVGYRLTQEVRVESSDVEKVERISREISELLDKGINLDNNNLSYYYTKLSDLKVEMLAEATDNAKNRAETIAKSAGSRLGALQTANMGVFQITAPNSTDEDYSWGGTFNTTSKKKRASINMRLTYQVK